MNAFHRDYIQAKALRDVLYERKRELMKDHEPLLGMRDKENVESALSKVNMIFFAMSSSSSDKAQLP